VLTGVSACALRGSPLERAEAPKGATRLSLCRSCYWGSEKPRIWNGPPPGRARRPTPREVLHHKQPKRPLPWPVIYSWHADAPSPRRELQLARREPW